jgi:hypothetical protein
MTGKRVGDSPPDVARRSRDDGDFTLQRVGHSQ